MYNQIMQNLSSKLLNRCQQITYTFTTRHEGLSVSPFNTNNLAFHVGDNSEVVIQNHLKLAQKMGYQHSDLVHMRQIHSDTIIIVNPDIHNFENPPECDALITDIANIPLMVMTADCTPVLLFDNVKAVKGIVPKTIEKMCTSFGSNIEDITVVLGPSIHSCCYEVGEKVANEIMENGYGLAIVYENEKYSLDVNTIIHKQLKESGVHKENIEDLNICNACENQDFFSYRADNQKTGRIGGVLMLRH
jgi:YfiH family protein